jgi:hypothetical protein
MTAMRATLVRPHAFARRAAFPRALRELALNGAHLAVLTAFAVAQPLFDLLSRNAEFFVVRGSTRWDIVAFALAVTLLPPAALVLVEAVVRLVDARLQRALHLVFVACLAGLFAIQLLIRLTGLSTAQLLAAAAVSGVCVAAAYGLARPARMLVTALTPAPLVFLALFLLVSPVAKLTLPRGEPDVARAAVAAPTTQAPVVMVVFDEFPVLSLMDARERIDAVRYPNFAALARDAIWFRNATTVATSTTVAVPAILTGMYPRKGALPSFDDHPKNLFTLLGGRYRLNVIESQTRLCPRSLCRATARSPGFRARMSSLYADLKEIYLQLVLPPELAAERPSVTTSWMDFAGGADTEAEPVVERAPTGRRKRARYRIGRRAEFSRFVRSIHARGRPSLNFIHVVLPHGPWEYFPSGTQYPPLVAAVGQPRDGGVWHDDALLVRQSQERHLLQVGFVDRLLGELTRRLRRIGVYERSLIVVTADQGISFRAGEKRRDPTAANLQDIVYVPLIVKPPRLPRGAVQDAHVETVDVLPTIADALGVSLPWRVDGRSVLRQPGSPLVRLPLEGVAVDAARLAVRRRAALRRQVSFFRSGRRTRLFSTSPYPELLGRRLSTLAVTPRGETRARVEHTTRRLLRSVQPASGVVPALIGGKVEGDRAAAGMTVAVALNGRVQAVTRTYEVSGNVRFAALLRESSFRRGRNKVDVLGVEPAGRRLRLRLLGSA